MEEITGMIGVNHTMKKKSVKIGALYGVWDAERSAVLRRSRYNAISHAAGTPGSPQVRNKATIVGNVCRASSANLISPLTALGTKAKIVGDGPERVVKVEEMLPGPGRTIPDEGKTATELKVSEMPGYTGCAYYKLSSRRSLDPAVVGVAVMMGTDPKHTVSVSMWLR